MFEAYFCDDLDEPGYAYLWEDDKNLEEDLDDYYNHPSLTAAERNPSLFKS